MAGLTGAAAILFGARIAIGAQFFDIGFQYAAQGFAFFGIY